MRFAIFLANNAGVPAVLAPISRVLVAAVALTAATGWGTAGNPRPVAGGTVEFPREPAPQPSQSRCADCHFANPDAPERRHLAEWDVSPHGRNRIGCESCHAGDPTTFDILPSHAGILGASNPASPTNRSNLPGTCGTCHAGPYVAFQRSRHFGLLEAGDDRVPTCVTCHGDVGAHLLSPRSLESQCSSCHGIGQVAERPAASSLARQMLESISEVRVTLEQARALIDRVEDGEEKTSLEYDYEQAQVPLVEATAAGHAFEFTALEERLNTSRRRVEALMLRILGG